MDLLSRRSITFLFFSAFVWLFFGTIVSHVHADSLSATITNINHDSGTYDIVINANAASGVDHISVPIWRDADHNDIYWYTATKQANGTYIARMSIGNHKYHRGTFFTHVYMYGKNGQTTVIAAPMTTINDVNKLSGEIVNVTSTGYDVIIHASAGKNTIANIDMPTWSSASQQADIVWYHPTLQSDGTYKQHVNIANHRNNQGIYITHIYMDTSNGERVGLPLSGVMIAPDVLETTTDKTRINGKYSFIAQWIPGKTTLETFGGSWGRDLYTYGGATNVRFLAPNDAQKGKVGVIYHNVGIYNGKIIDLKVTALDWKAITGKNGYIEYTEGVIAHLQQKYYYVKQKWEFIDATTGQPIDINGYMTISDIDSRQGVTFDPSTVKNISNIYLTQDTRVAMKQEKDGGLTLYDGPYWFADPTDKRAQFTFTFSNTSEIVFSWTLNERPPEEFPRITPPTLGNEYNGEFFSFTGKKIAKTTAIPPDKFIKPRGSNVLQQKSVLQSLDEELTYEIYYTVNDENAEYYYKNYKMKDILPDGLNLMSARIYNMTGSDLTTSFNNESSGNTVQFSAPLTLLNNSNFYNTVYRLEIKAKPKSYDALTHLISDNKIEFNNTAYVSIDNEPEVSSKTVSTEVYVNGNVPIGQVIHYDQSIDATGSSKESIIQSDAIQFQEHKTWHADLREVPVRTVEWNAETNSYVWSTHTEIQDFGYYVYTYSYSIQPRNDLYKTTKTGKYKYVPMTTQTYSGTNLTPSERNNVQIKIPYIVPQASINAEKLVVDTDDAEKGLPFILKLNKNELQFKNRNTDFQNVTLKLSILDLNTQRKLWETTTAYYNLPTEYKGKLNVQGYNNGEKIPIKVEFSVINNQDERELLFDEGVFNSYAYTASHEKIIGNTPLNQANESTLNSSVTEYPIRTEKNRDQEVKTYYETFIVNVDSKIKTKTGYGIAPNFVFKYKNELNRTYNLNIDVLIPETFITKDDKIEAVKEKDNYRIQLDNSYQFPRMYVKKESGAIYNLRYINDIYSFVDGGFNLYIPVWHKLGNYPIAYTFHAGTIGANYISLDIKSVIDIYAYMYATSKSKTIESDELLIRPSINKQ